MSFRKRAIGGLAGMVVGGSVLLSGCAEFVGGLLIADHHAHVQGRQNTQQAANCFNSDWTLQYLRNSFSREEQIAFVADVPSKRGYLVSLTIFNGPNSKMRKDNVGVGSPGDLGTRRVVVYPLGFFAPGNYTGVWRDNNRDYLGQSTIVVND